MKIFFKQDIPITEGIDEEYSIPDLKDALKKTHLALDNAYSGFDNATETDLIDSYIYEIISLQKRYKYLAELAEQEHVPEPTPVKHFSSIRALTSHVFG